METTTEKVSQTHDMVATSKDVWQTLRLFEQIIDDVDYQTGYYTCKFLREYANKLAAEEITKKLIQ